MYKIALAATMIATSALAETPTPPQKPADVSAGFVVGCHPKEKVEKILQRGGFTVLYRGTGADGKVHELWLNSDGYTAMVAFDSPPDGEHSSISTVCLVDATEKTMYNGDTIEQLFKALEKNGKRT